MGLLFYIKIYKSEISHLVNREIKGCFEIQEDFQKDRSFSREGFFQRFEKEDLKLLVSQFLLLSKWLRIGVLKSNLSLSCY